MGEHPATSWLPEAERLDLEPVRAARAALDALCWVLGHDHNVTFQENLDRLRWWESVMNPTAEAGGLSLGR